MRIYILQHFPDCFKTAGVDSFSSGFANISTGARTERTYARYNKNRAPPSSCHVQRSSDSWVCPLKPVAYGSFRLLRRRIQVWIYSLASNPTHIISGRLIGLFIAASLPASIKCSIFPFLFIHETPGPVALTSPVSVHWFSTFINSER